MNVVSTECTGSEARWFSNRTECSARSDLAVSRTSAAAGCASAAGSASVAPTVARPGRSTVTASGPALRLTGASKHTSGVFRHGVASRPFAVTATTRDADPS